MTTQPFPRRLASSGLAAAVCALALSACAGQPARPTDALSASAAGPAGQPTADPSASPSVQPPAAESPASEADGNSARRPSQGVLDQRLRDAAWANDVPRARRLIRQGADVNAKDSTEQSAYLVATSEGYLSLLRLTLARSADVTALDSWNGTGLIRAAERGHALVVGELVRAGIALDHVNRIGYQAIHEAVWLGDGGERHTTTVRVLVAAGAEVDLVSPSAGLTPLQMARSRGHAAMERTLDAAERAPRIAPAARDRALLTAAERGDADAVALALRAGADIEARDARGRTALLLASTFDRVAVARLLVAMGADPDALDDRHDTAWLVTGVTGSVAMAEALLPARPDLGIENRFGGLSPIPAAERGHADYLRRVARTRVDLDHVNDLGWTALLEAVILGDGGAAHVETVRVLLEAGVDTTIADRDGVSALEHARRTGQSAIVEEFARAARRGR